jgi:hypothetical protein
MKIAQLREQRQAKRAHFLALLAKTANVGLSSRLSGLGMPSLYHHRHANPAFDQAWGLALQQGKTALASGWAPAAILPNGRACVVGRAADGSPILKEARWDQWNPDKERRFLDMLAETNNIRMSVEAAGISDDTIYTRRKQWPEFAKAMADAQQRAIEALTERVIEAGSPTLAPPQIPFHVEPRIESVAKALRTVELFHPKMQDRPRVRHRPGVFSGAKRRKPEPLLERLSAALVRVVNEDGARGEDVSSSD